MTSPTQQIDASSRQIAGNHYKRMAIQPYKYCYSNKFNNLQSEAISYISRYNLKHIDPLKQIEDLKKAIHTLELLIEEIEVTERIKIETLLKGIENEL